MVKAGRQKSLAAMKRKQGARPPEGRWGGAQEREKVVRDVQLPETIVVSELANRMAERVGDVVKGADEQRHDGHAEPDDRCRYRPS